MDATPFQRLELLVGHAGFSALQQAKVAVFGLGGVGSWAAESLVRSGIGHLMLVDSDTVNASNLNRQLPALHSSIGKFKGEVLAERFMDINPQLSLEVRHEFYQVGDGDKFALQNFDYVVDAIDTIDPKVDLLMSACALGAKVFSSMGAGNKLDPTQIRIANIWQTKHCPLAKVVRTKLRTRGFQDAFTCVFSLEESQILQENQVVEGKRVNGSLAPITISFGQHLASLVIQDCLRKAINS